MANSKSRIWELDALRGVCILCVIVVHFLFDLSFFGGFQLTLPAWYVFLQEYGGAIFVLLSGCCATLGTRSVRRGCIVFAAGMLITGVTYGMYRLGMSGADVVVKFGVLHLLGVCMILYPIFKKLPPAALASLGIIIAVTGFAIRGVVVPQHWLFPLGLTYEGFVSSDYFPLFPAAGLLFHRRCHRQNRLPRKKDAAARHVRKNACCPLLLLVRQAVAVYLSSAPAHRLRASRAGPRFTKITASRKSSRRSYASAGVSYSVSSPRRLFCICAFTNAISSEIDSR